MTASELSARSWETCCSTSSAAASAAGTAAPRGPASSPPAPQGTGATPVQQSAGPLGARVHRGPLLALVDLVHPRRVRHWL